MLPDSPLGGEEGLPESWIGLYLPDKIEGWRDRARPARWLSTPWLWSSCSVLPALPFSSPFLSSQIQCGLLLGLLTVPTRDVFLDILWTLGPHLLWRGWLPPLGRKLQVAATPTGTAFREGLGAGGAK